MTPPRPPMTSQDEVTAPDIPASAKTQREIELEALLAASEKKAKEAEQKRIEAEHKTIEAEHKTIEAEHKTQKLPLVSFLKKMEETVFPILLVEKDPSKTAATGPTKVAGKMYPSSIQPWTDFPALHNAAFNRFRDGLGDMACFLSPYAIEVNADSLSRGIRTFASEDDIRPFIALAIETPAAAVMTEYLRVLHPEKQYEIVFRNNAYSMLAATQDGKRFSPDKDLQPDRWTFLYNDQDGNELRENILVGEYKAPHKLKVATLRRVMDSIRVDTFFPDAIRGSAEVPVDSGTASSGNGGNGGNGGNRSNTAPSERVSGHVLVAQTLCQIYHYLVGSGCEFGYISAGNSLVLLKVDAEPPYTMHYHAAYFSVPSIKDAADRRQASRGLRQVNETAAAYLATLCQLAWQTRARTPEWIAQVKKTAARWPVSRSQLGSTTLASGRNNDSDGPGGGDDRPGGTGGEGGSSGPSGAGGAGSGVLRSGTVRLPLPSNFGKSDRSPDPSRRHNGYEAMSVSCKQMNTPPPSKEHAFEPPTLPYCTQACLLGLTNGLPLDIKCPNVALHRAARIRHGAHASGNVDGHALTAASLRARLVDQIAANMNKDCESLARFGLTGRNAALFKLAVTGFGYTFVGKSVLATMRPMLEQEVKVYRAVAHLQGHLVPVCLGLIDLAEPIPLQNCQEVAHMLLLSYAGPDCATRNIQVPTGVDLEEEGWRTTCELQRAGVYNEDVRDSNVAWNDEVRRVMHFDFDWVDMDYLATVAVLEEEQSVPDGDEKTTHNDVLVKTETASAIRSPLLDKGDWNGVQQGVANDGNAKKHHFRDDNVLADPKTPHGNETRGPARKRVRQ